MQFKIEIAVAGLIIFATIPVNASLFHHHHRSAAALTISTTPALARTDMPEPSGIPAAPSSERSSPYDEVTYAVSGSTDGVSIVDPSVPAGSFVEVTDLATGKTILALVRAGSGAETIARGSNPVVSLSTQALSLLGSTGNKLPIRVRRVHPPEQEQAALLSGHQAGDRLDTPEMLLVPLRRKLAGTQGQIATLAPAKPAVIADNKTQTKFIIEKPFSSITKTGVQHVPKWSRPVPVKTAAASPVAKPLFSPKPVSVSATLPVPKLLPAAQGTIFIQLAALSDAAHARALANKAGGTVSQSGAHFRVRTGPYQSEAQAHAALGSLATKGYPGAKIVH